ncbi:hypothetical protein CHS0354_031022 [Potamilus streckersoni]|uniref:Uncharacterized protein n=1 Tax=Potamilus streckersoni TaxID=2493646 RepID=A0AAE0TD64_9BIVA|nr:hypothetical protein CHS0354_031022 [Potamilus streckersoni]
MGILLECSAMDMILKMKENAVSKGQFDLVYEKVFLYIWCLGIVGMSSRNCVCNPIIAVIGDLLRPFKYLPNITMADIAHLVASLANKIQRNFFYPNGRRLAPPYDKNIALSKNNEPSFEITLQQISEMRDNRLQTLQEHFRDIDILTAFHDLSSADIENIQQNIKYANDIFFRSTDFNRQRQVVSPRKINGYIIKCQGATNYCGLCCINHALGPMEDDLFPVTIEEMVADLLWIDMDKHPAHLGNCSLIEISHCCSIL